MIIGTLCVLVFAVVYWKALPERLRPVALLLFGVALYRAAAASIAINVALVFVLLLILRKRSRRAGLATGFAVLVLLINKYAGVPGFQVIGLSYVTFRLISLSRDIEKQNRPSPPLVPTLVYALFPPTFLSGPIEPYARFDLVRVPSNLSSSELFASLFRLASGLAKKLILVEPLRGFSEATFGPSLPESTLWPGLFAYSLFVYLDFSSYSDLAIGGARLFGYPIGENFDWPYLSASISEFWTRWHISLSHFLRDHVFLPLSNRVLKINGLASFPGWVGVMASLVTMTLCGMWHGDRASFALWGLGHGVCLGLHQFHRQKLIGRLKARQRMRLQSHWAYRACATSLTFVVVTLLWVPFRFSIAESSVVYRRLLSVLFHSIM